MLQYRSRFFIVAVFAGMLSVLLALVGCSSNAEPNAEPDPDEGDIVKVDGEGAIEIALDYSAGTGYEWECSVEPAEGVLVFQYQDTQDMAEDELIEGGPLRDYVLYRAAGPGKATVTCNLVRSWEDGDPAETQTYVFDVNDDLQIQFIAEESDYVNPPTQVYNS